MTTMIPFSTLDQTHGEGQLSLPALVYHTRVERLEDVLTQETQKLMFKLTMTIVAPAEYAGLRLYDNFVIGSESDPTAADPETWKSVTGKRFHRFVKRSGVPYSESESTDAFFSRAVGAELIVATVLKIDNGSNPKYAGKSRTNVANYFAVGEKPVGETGRATGTGTPSTAATVPTPKNTLVTCTSCRERVDRVALPAHLARHAAESGLMPPVQS